MFMKECKHLTDYSLIAVASSSYYFGDFFKDKTDGINTLFIFYLKKKSFEADWKLKIKRINEFKVKYDKIFMEMHEQINRAKHQNCFLIWMMLNEDLVAALNEA